MHACTLRPHPHTFRKRALPCSSACSASLALCRTSLLLPRLLLSSAGGDRCPRGPGAKGSRGVVGVSGSCISKRTIWPIRLPVVCAHAQAAALVA